MLRVTEVVLVLLSPTLALSAVLQGRRLLSLLLARRRARRPVPTAAPLERLAADARRLRGQLIAAEDGPDATPGRGLRVRALRAAYADCLQEAGRALDVPLAETAPDGADLFRLEAALRERGLEVASVRAR